jgi:hypothetical protein
VQGYSTEELVEWCANYSLRFYIVVAVDFFIYI